MLENEYQAHLIKLLRAMFPGCFILKNDTDYLQGVPDLLILYRNKWAMLEVKASATSPSRPNQEYYVDMLNEMSYSAFIYPENEEQVLYEIQQAFRARRSSRIPQRQ